MHPLVDHLVVLVFAVAYPAYGAWSYPRLLRRIDAGQPAARVRTYARVIVVQWTLVGIALGWWAHTQRAWTDLGLMGSPSPQIWEVATVMTVPLLWSAAQVRRLARDPGLCRDVRLQLQQSPRMRGMFPHTGLEYAAFLGVSVTAGTCEEILFRGYLMAYLQGLGLEPILAALASGVWFGLAHGYQGKIGVLKTGAVGLVLVAVYLWTGSLWTSMALHILIDVHSGTVGWLAFRQPVQRARSTGVGQP
jgi:membrane protease YdiL (CAAX protease family)